MAARTSFALAGAEHPHALQITARLLALGCIWKAACDLENAPLAVALPNPGPRQILPFQAILDAHDIDIVVCGHMPARRAQDALAVMRHSKDALCPKPAILDFEQLARLRTAHKETQRFFTVWFSERLASPSTLRAIELVREGAIGKLVHVIGLGPHQLSAKARPRWFFDSAMSGGILCDLFSHHADQFLTLTGTSAEVLSASIANHATPAYPDFDDLGMCTLRSREGVTGFFKVDWLSPQGLGAWGDGRLMLQGVDGTVEVRKTIDPAGRDGSDHLILVNDRGIERSQPTSPRVDFFAAYLRDVASRSQEAISQAHVFDVCDLALRAERTAREARAFDLDRPKRNQSANNHPVT